MTAANLSHQSNGLEIFLKGASMSSPAKAEPKPAALLIDAFLAAKRAQAHAAAVTKAAREALDRALSAKSLESVRDAGEDRFMGSIGYIQLVENKRFDTDACFSAELQKQSEALRAAQTKERKDGTAIPNITQSVRVYFNDDK